MAVSIHRQHDRGMAHDGLDHVRVHALQGQPCSGGVPEAVKVHRLALVVLDG